MDEPPIAAIGALIGDPARALMLSALMDGRARTATELAIEAGIGRATASAHLAKLTNRNLLCMVRQGRHRYFRLAGDDVASVLETLMVLGGADRGRPRSPRSTPEREARTCYDHLAGRVGVALLDALAARRYLALDDAGVGISAEGRAAFERCGVDIDVLDRARRPRARLCLDWSERRNHLAGGLGAALLEQFLQRRWVCRQAGSRAVTLSPAGRRALRERFGVEL